ncbi:hypothetical protein BEL04_06660 [Mucilaginibacter sp. PPCGB 2223]|uniref:DUF423 domain-containing protein n=1 Tax=Mucilaginibacter sp. PPCGB 2223 TaxID=1886027 RepID=UPI0008271879|nr:DUF423 domain-containing protein [Mucilaginibacter sp. PPCGB 2223]OCX53956.1 hypothetical protein BEL04_06660 [Mucilaginibacter sp. PPCGB 2223]
MNKQIIVTGALFGLLAVVAGAFGAHGLEAKLDAKQLEVWHTAVQYQFYHVFALLFLSTFTRFKNNLIAASYYLFTFGIICFSGSLYLFVFGHLFNWNLPTVIGVITPIGGLLFIAGWATLAVAAIRNK